MSGVIGHTINNSRVVPELVDGAVSCRRTGYSAVAPALKVRILPTRHITDEKDVAP